MTNEIGQAPPLQHNARDADALLLDFVRDRDVNCPRCGYNLRNLSTPVCPECKEPLKLQVGAEKIRLFWLLITLAPGAFCGVVIGIFGVMFVVTGGGNLSGPVPIGAILLISFFVLSAATAITLALMHRRFLRFSLATQFIWALAMWSCHLIAFAIFILNVS